MNIWISIIGFLIVAGGFIVLQAVLSRKKSKWFGLILPGIFVIISLVMVFIILVRTSNMPAGEFDIQTFIQIAAHFINVNIPTIIFLCIYFICRRKRRKKKELEKMNIQDLE